jgi:hypothetical protein
LPHCAADIPWFLGGIFFWSFLFHHDSIASVLLTKDYLRNSRNGPSIPTPNAVGNFEISTPSSHLAHMATWDHGFVPVPTHKSRWPAPQPPWLAYAMAHFIPRETPCSLGDHPQNPGFWDGALLWPMRLSTGCRTIQSRNAILTRGSLCLVTSCRRGTFWLFRC